MDCLECLIIGILIYIDNRQIFGEIMVYVQNLFFGGITEN